MCTSIIYNGNKTIVGWNLDVLNMAHKIVTNKDGVYICVYDETQGYLPLFGCNDRGDFVAMPTCWPYDKASEKTSEQDINIINLDIDLLLKKNDFETTLKRAENSKICSVPNLTFQCQLTNKNGDVLQVTSGQGAKFYKKPKYMVMTNFSPFKDNGLHPLQGVDRYNLATKLLENANCNFDVDDCFNILKQTAQTVCPTVVSMVFDVTNNAVFWCENRNFNNVQKYILSRSYICHH